MPGRPRCRVLLLDFLEDLLHGLQLATHLIEAHGDVLELFLYLKIAFRAQ